MNPFLKTLITGVLASPAIGAEIANPTGGFAAYLTSHPIAATVYGLGLVWVHNIISAAAPPAPKS